MKTAGGHRFEVLDSLRGLCALLVVFFHLPVSSHFHALPLTRHGYLFVDFFFVLSGFVIAHAYGGRLRSAGEVGRFVICRLGRVWPLHAAMLAAFVALELGRLWFHFDAATPFTGDRSPEAILSNLLLIQAFNIHDHQTWNGPAWSISVEMGAYGVFAGLLWLAPRRFLPLAILIAVGGAVLILGNAPGYMNTTYDLGFPRALYGFFLGGLVHRLWQAGSGPGRRATGWLEPACLIGVVAFVSWATGPWTVGAPLVFAVCVWVFATQKGLLSHTLKVRPLLSLGRWSYSIYMTHMLVITVMLILARKAQVMPGGRRIDFGSVWLNDLFAVAVVCGIVALSAMTYRLIETPGRDLVNNWLARRTAARSKDSGMAAAPTN